MDSFIETSLKNFCSTCDIFGESSIYVDFLSKEKEHGINSGVMFGRIVYRTGKNEEKLSQSLVLKNMPSKHLCQGYILVHYYNEIFFYSRAFPFFQQLGSFQSLLPIFYDSYINSSPQNTKFTLIYEDLKARGFRNHERFSFLDLDHLTMMLHALGKFHSFSYFAKSKYPQEFGALGNWFKCAEAEIIRERPNYFHLFAQIGLQRLRQDARYSSHIAKVEKVLENADALVLQMNMMEQKEFTSVLCHGDYLRGNVMFLYENGQPVDMKMIDMATCRIASPVIDLSLVLYLNADQQTRNQHWNHLINSYYEGLCQVFGGIGVPSKESILKEFFTKVMYGYLIASHFLPFLIEMDRGTTAYYNLYADYAPTEYADRPMSEIPEPILEDMLKKWCNEEGAEALADILRDMVDRRFI